MDLIKELKKEKLIAIIRGFEGEVLKKIAEALIEGGIRFVEVTMNTPQAATGIAQLKEAYGEQIHLGAGTVLDVQMAKEAVQAGATYLITPNVNADVIAYAVEQEIEIWPGAFTPTEIAYAAELGARAVKVFPVSFVGPHYLEAIRGPLDHIPLIAVGGVRVDQFSAYLQAGAIAIGVGNHLIDPTLIRSGKFDQLSQRAKEFVRKIKEGEK